MTNLPLVVVLRCTTLLVLGAIAACAPPDTPEVDTSCDDVHATLQRLAALAGPQASGAHSPDAEAFAAAVARHAACDERSQAERACVVRSDDLAVALACLETRPTAAALGERNGAPVGPTAAPPFPFHAMTDHRESAR